jgi:hypothetical protein
VLGYTEGVAYTYDMKSVFQKISEIRTSMSVYIDIRGQYGGTVRAQLSEALGRAGFVLATIRHDADIVVDGAIKIKPIDVGNPELKYSRAIITLAVRDVEAGVSVGEISEDKRGVSVTSAESEKSALRKVLPSVKNSLLGLLERE